jgi:segregation and condensation protein A
MTSPSAPTTALGAEPGFVVKLDAFSGPLDLLLHLLREEQIDIADIPIARIADQFLSAIHELGLNQAADYLEMAGRLVRLKAQMLLPRREGEEGWEDPRHELVRRLLEYQLVREVAGWLERASERRADQYPRGFLPPPPELPPPALTLDLLELLKAVEQVISEIPSPVLHRVVARPLDTEGATRRLEAMLLELEEFTWLEALGKRPTIVDVLSTLLALLELARRGLVRLTQPEAFASFLIRRETPRTEFPSVLEAEAPASVALEAAQPDPVAPSADAALPDPVLPDSADDTPRPAD